MSRNYRDFLYTPWTTYAQPSPLSASHTTVVHLLESMNPDKYLSPLFTLGFTLGILYLILTLRYYFIGFRKRRRETSIKCLLYAPRVGFKAITFWCTGQHTNQLSHLSRATLGFIHSVVLNKYIMTRIHYCIFYSVVSLPP